MMKRLLVLLFLFPILIKSQNTIPSTTVSGCLKVNGTSRIDSSLVVGDTMRAQDVNVSNDAKITGNLDVGGDASFGGKLIANQGITLDNTTSLKISSTSTPSGNVISYGKILPVVPTCPMPNTGNSNINHVFPGFMTSQANTSLFSAALNIGSAPWNGSGYLEVEGTDQLGGDNNAFFINYFCGRNTYINVNNGLANKGGTVYMGEQVAMASSLKIGYDATPLVDPLTSLTVLNNNHDGIKFVTPWNNSRVISISNSNFAKSPFTVYADGRTRIGIETVTSRPGTLLHVGGEIDCKSLFVLKPTTWADYVFNKNTKHNSIYDEEKYISSHGHLKGIPSEKEVLENGYDINEMNAKLLAKLEEAYLHIIKLQKEVDELKNKLK